MGNNIVIKLIIHFFIKEKQAKNEQLKSKKQLDFLNEKGYIIIIIAQYFGIGGGRKPPYFCATSWGS